MKLFQYWIGNRKDTSCTVSNMIKAYEGGAEEMLKSLRCETCRYMEPCLHKDNEGLNSCAKVGFVTKMDFGCIHHEEKE